MNKGGSNDVTGSYTPYTPSYVTIRCEECGEVLAVNPITEYASNRDILRRKADLLSEHKCSK
jgi:hypothetical protein